MTYIPHTSSNWNSIVQFVFKKVVSISLQYTAAVLERGPGSGSETAYGRNSIPRPIPTEVQFIFEKLVNISLQYTAAKMQ